MKAVNQMQEAYVYSSDQLSIESVNAAAAPTFVVYPDGLCLIKKQKIY